MAVDANLRRVYLVPTKQQTKQGKVGQGQSGMYMQNGGQMGYADEFNPYGQQQMYDPAMAQMGAQGGFGDPMAGQMYDNFMAPGMMGTQDIYANQGQGMMGAPMGGAEFGAPGAMGAFDNPYGAHDMGMDPMGGFGSPQGMGMPGGQFGDPQFPGQFGDQFGGGQDPMFGQIDPFAQADPMMQMQGAAPNQQQGFGSPQGMGMQGMGDAAGHGAMMGAQGGMQQMQGGQQGGPYGAGAGAPGAPGQAPGMQGQGGQVQHPGIQQMPGGAQGAPGQGGPQMQAGVGAQNGAPGMQGQGGPGGAAPQNGQNGRPGAGPQGGRPGMPVNPYLAQPGKAKTALILSIVSIVLSFLAPVTLVLALIANKMANEFKRNGGSSGTGDAAKIFSIAGIVFSSLMMALYIWFFGYYLGYAEWAFMFLTPIAYYNNSPIGSLLPIPVPNT